MKKTKKQILHLVGAMALMGATLYLVALWHWMVLVHDGSVCDAVDNHMACLIPHGTIPAKLLFGMAGSIFLGSIPVMLACFSLESWAKGPGE